MLPENRVHSSSPEDDATTTVAVNLDQEIEVEDSTADFNVKGPLPPRGIYPVKWKVGPKGVIATTTKKEPFRSYVATDLFGQIVADGEAFDGAPVFVNHINSLTMRNKPTSELHHLLNILGAPAPNKIKVGELLAFTEEVLEQNPVGMAEIDWRAAFKNDKGEWKDIATRMESFPKHKDETTGKWDGTFESEIESPVNGEKISAQLYVRQHLSQNEAKKMAKSA